MDIILISHSRGQTWKYPLRPRSPWVWLPLALLPIATIAAAVVLGYSLAPSQDRSAQVASATALWDEQIATQRREIESLRDRIENNVHALAQRLGRLQAHVTRLNAAGERMSQVAGLDASEFDFNQQPPVGGPRRESSESTPSMDALDTALDEFERELDTRERQMQVLRELMVAGELHDEVMPSGRPVGTGWISSTFGWRTDPFNGRRSRHEGIDFAAAAGSEVVSVASGVVTKASSTPGYGLLVEINHGNGYVTRYGHNRKALVEVGERVSRGQQIAELGSTGRSTGPHVHFEVVHNGKVVDPAEYIHAAH